MGEPELDAIDAIYDALDRGDAAAALEFARQARLESGDDPVLAFLAGMALLELGRLDEAIDELTHATAEDPGDSEFRANLALALFRACRFDEARQAAREALDLDSGAPDAHHVTALLLEREGDPTGAEKHFKRAAALDPERFPRPTRVERRAFEQQLELARERLPASFRDHLERVAVIIEEVPSEALLREEEPPLDPELLGLFVGLTAGERESPLTGGGDLPPRIYLFKRNLERCVADASELAEQIAVTLYHELGHYLGMDEDDLEAVDFG